jgi:hypothetical protein
MFDPLRPELRAAITAVDGWEIADRQHLAEVVG